MIVLLLAVPVSVTVENHGDNRTRVLLWHRYNSTFICTTSHSPILTGGLHYALEKSSIDARVIAAFDWDQLACKVYSHNFPETVVRKVPMLVFM